MATNKTTVSVYADDDLLAALNQFKDSGNHKSLNVAIVAILREKLFGEATDNVQSKVQGNVSSTLDIESKINEAIAAAMAHSAAPDMGAIEAMIDNRIAALKQSINDEFIDMKQAIAAIETTRSEATAPTKKPLMQIARERVIAA